MHMNDGKISMSYYFSCIANKAADKRAIEVLKDKIHHKFSDFFSGIGCFEGTFTIQVKAGI